jgi:polysaccharide biosynthesis protein PslH
MTAGQVRAGHGAILIVSPDAPGPLDRGFRIRVHHLAAQLARAYPVTLLAPAPDDPAAARPLQQLGVDVRAAPDESRGSGVRRDVRRAMTLLLGGSASWSERRFPELRRAAARLLAQEGAYMAVQVEVPELADLPVPAGLPVVLDAHNIWSELAARRLAAQVPSPSPRRRLQDLDRRRYASAERAAWRAARACLVTSEREAPVLRESGAREVLVVPNGVDVGGIAPRPGQPAGPSRQAAGPPRLLFVGLMGYGPNADAVRWAVREILPRIRRERPDVTLRVVGGEVPPDVQGLRGPGVEIAGRVDDVGRELADAAVVVVPLRAGGGTRLKILEAMAAARPIVTTRIGCEGINVRDGTHLLVRDDAGSFAEAVLRLLRDPDRAEALGACGRELAERRYAWPVAAAPLVELYGRLARTSLPA